MKKLVAIALLGSLAGATAAAAIEPIPGSITYGGQPKTRLQKAPVGSLLFHQFYGQNGNDYRETYRIRPDRGLELLDRRELSIRED